MDTTQDALVITTSVPAFGAVIYDLGINASYDAAKRGEILTVRVGKKLRVPVLMALAPVLGEKPDPGQLAAIFARLREAEAAKRAA
jgi:hypothetical protein